LVVNKINCGKDGTGFRKKDISMLRITILNETPKDRKEIYSLLQSVAEESDIVIKEILMWNEVVFMTENHTLIQLRNRDILYFEYCNRKIKIVTTKENYICINEKIGNIAEKMRRYGFVMPHQSFVVNPYQVERITTQSLIMKNGDEVYLAQKRASAIRKEFRSQSQKILL